MHRARHPALAALLVPALLAGIVLAGCGATGPGARPGKLDVVAAEDFWGSIAEQLGGEKVEVTSIVANPAADPHDYEPTAADARELAGAEMSIVNGIGYDEWASKLLAANPDEGRTELDLGEALGLEDGDNPHQWYSPESVHAAIDRMVADYERALPGNDAYFERRKDAFEARGLAEYDALITEIEAKYAGAPVGASESIFEPLAQALGLRLLTPRGFLDAVAEGAEPTPADKARADRQIADRRIRVWIYNSQNATPDVQRLDDAAGSAGIPIATVSETPTPEGTSFQAWMTRELRGLAAALARAGGRE